MTPLLVIDVSYLCHRAFHTTRDLSWQGVKTGVIFGFLKSIGQLKDEFQTDRIAFCFEHPHLFRRDVFPAYKERRRTKKRTEEERKAYRELNRQIDALQKEHLPRIGFQNVFCVEGYESDDLMASLAQHAKDDVILVTADNDLLQCLKPNVSIWNPAKQKLLTEDWFVSTYEFEPRYWALVKAIAGCSSDGVPGVRGIGEMTAIRYTQGALPETWQAFRNIRSHGETVLRNRMLVELPFVNCPRLEIKPDNISKEGWREVCGRLGMKSLASRPPVATRKLK